MLAGHNEVLLSGVETKFHGSSLDDPPQRFPKKELASWMSAKLDSLYSLNCKIASTQSGTNEVDLDTCFRSNVPAVTKSNLPFQRLSGLFSCLETKGIIKHYGDLVK